MDGGGMSLALEINNLSVFYGEDCALEKISLDVAEHEFLGIIGPNGGGKTTLLKAILGLVQPQSGTVRIFGETGDKARRNIGYVPQFSRFDRRFPISVEEVVLMGRLAGRSPWFVRYDAKDLELVESLLGRLEIADLKKRQIGQLSGGQLQRVLIARALAVEPRILILDEPTASVDSASKTRIYEILKELNAEMTILIVTHDLSAVSSNIDKIACLNQQLFYHGRTELEAGLVEKVYGCPVDLIAHGVPHRVLRGHEEGTL
jgi:zinc transport system ATP-binding protein